MQFVVRFDRPATSTGPDAVLLTAARFSESYHEGMLVAYLFWDAEDAQVALVRAAHVVYIAAAGTASEPGRPAQTPDDAASEQTPAAGAAEFTAER